MRLEILGSVIITHAVLEYRLLDRRTQ